MKERKSATIDIRGRRLVKGEYKDDYLVYTAPITASSKRVFSLMGEDYIQLEFLASDAVFFTIGDYIDDELFGRFYITDEQMPSDDKTTNGFRYALRFDAWYMVWKNLDFMMTTRLKRDGTLGERVRKETQWYLTNDLAHQAEELINNLSVLGYAKCSYVIDEDLSTQYDSNLMSYADTKITEALNMLADTWECEWWVTGKESDFVVHFGKCENKGDAVDMKRSLNVETMSIQRNADTYANKFYVFGSKDNIPTTYRKDLTFTVKSTEVIRGKVKRGEEEVEEITSVYSTIDKKLTPQMFGVKDAVTYDYSLTNVKNFSKAFTEDSTVASFAFNKEVKFTSLNSRVSASYFSLTKFKPTLTFKNTSSLASVVGAFQIRKIDSVKTTVLVYAAMKRGNAIAMMELGRHEEETAAANVKITNGTDTWDLSYEIEKISIEGVSKTLAVKEMGYYEDFYIGMSVTFAIDVTTTNFTTAQIAAMFVDQMSKAGTETIINLDGLKAVKWTAEGDDSTTYKQTFTYANPSLRFGAKLNGTKVCEAVANPLSVESTDAKYGCVSFYEKGTDTFVTANAGDKFTIDDEYTIEIPQSYYVSQYDDSSSLLRLGDMRLQCPLMEKTEKPNDFVLINGGYWLNGNWAYKDGYIIRKDLIANPKGVVEAAVCFDKIYPDGKMQIKENEIFREEKKTFTKYEDGSKNPFAWYQYHIGLRLVNGNDFTFKRSYVLSSVDCLKIRFLVPSDIKTDNPSVYNNLPKDAYGAYKGFKLAGMTFDLVFSTNASLTDLDSGRISHKQDFAIVRNDSFGSMLPNETLRPNEGDLCVLVGWNVKAMAQLGLIENAELRLLYKGIEYAQLVEEGQFTTTCEMMSAYIFKDVSGDEEYKLFDIGQKVKLYHDAFKDGIKQSRVIAYEYKLDKPYDTPKYTIGETDAYSRLKKIEKEITKLS